MIPDIKERLCSASGLEPSYRRTISFQLSPKNDLPMDSASIIRALRELFETYGLDFSAGYEEGKTTYFDVFEGDTRRYKGIVRDMTNSVFPIIDVLVIDVMAVPDPLANLLVGQHTLEEWKVFYLRNIPGATLVDTDSPGAFMIEFPYPNPGTGETLSVKYLDGNVAVLDKGHLNGTITGTWRRIGWEAHRIVSDTES